MLGTFLGDRDLKERWVMLFLAPDEPEFITGTKSDTNGSLFGRTICGVI
jgi:hypothetical protein